VTRGFGQSPRKANEVRATVVGSGVFSGKIDSQARVETQIDWRHRPFDIDEIPIQLPPAVEAKIDQLMQVFGFVHDALDFVVTADGERAMSLAVPAPVRRGGRGLPR